MPLKRWTTAGYLERSFHLTAPSLSGRSARAILVHVCTRQSGLGARGPGMEDLWRRRGRLESGGVIACTAGLEVKRALHDAALAAEFAGGADQSIVCFSGEIARF